MGGEGLLLCCCCRREERIQIKLQQANREVSCQCFEAAAFAAWRSDDESVTARVPNTLASCARAKRRKT